MYGVLLVSGLGLGVDEDSLDIFKVFGPASVNVFRPASHQRCGSAEINFANRSNADSAMKIMDGIVMEGRRIRVSWSFMDPTIRRHSASVFRKKPAILNLQESSHSFQEIYGILFVSGLGLGVNEETLDIFKVFGPASVNLVRPASHQLCGCAYITYANHSDADSAMKIMDGILIDGRRTRVIWSLGDPIIRQNSASIFIKNLIPWASKEDTETELITAFQNHGRVLYCKVPVQEHGWNRGFAIVQMGGCCEARKAVAALHDTVLNHHFGSNLYVIDASAFFSALSKHSKTSDNIVSDRPGECIFCCRAYPTRVSVCNYIRACMKCSVKYNCPICDAKYHPSILNFRLARAAVPQRPLLLE